MQLNSFGTSCSQSKNLRIWATRKVYCPVVAIPIRHYFFSQIPGTSSFPLEHRELRAVSLEAETAAFPAAATVLSVRRHSLTVSSGKETDGERFFIASQSLEDTSPREFAREVRDHWSWGQGRRQCFGFCGSSG